MDGVREDMFSQKVFMNEHGSNILVLVRLSFVISCLFFFFFF